MWQSLQLQNFCCCATLREGFVVTTTVLVIVNFLSLLLIGQLLADEGLLPVLLVSSPAAADGERQLGCSAADGPQRLNTTALTNAIDITDSMPHLIHAIGGKTDDDGWPSREVVHHSWTPDQTTPVSLDSTHPTTTTNSNNDGTATTQTHSSIWSIDHNSSTSSSSTNSISNSNSSSSSNGNANSCSSSSSGSDPLLGNTSRPSLTGLRVQCWLQMISVSVCLLMDLRQLQLLLIPRATETFGGGGGGSCSRWRHSHWLLVWLAVYSVQLLLSAASLVMMVCLVLTTAAHSPAVPWIIVFQLAYNATAYYCYAAAGSFWAVLRRRERRDLALMSLDPYS